MYLTFVFFAAIILPIPILINRMKKKTAPYRAVVEGIVAGLMGAVFFMILSSVSGSSVFEEMQESIDYMAKTLASNPTMTEAMGMEKSTQGEKIALYTSIYKVAADLIPSTIGIMTAIASYIEYNILNRILRIKDPSLLPMSKFREFNLPRNMMFGWVVIYAVSWVLTEIELFSSNILFMNLTALFNFTFCIQGISLLFKFAYVKKAPKAIAVILALFLMASSMGKLVLMILGFADLILGLKRKLS